jgi:plasmid stabilization system protein ParE
MEIAFLPAAQAELDDAFSWYEEQAVGLGCEFLDELDQALRLIAIFPELPRRQEGQAVSGQPFPLWHFLW